MTVTKVSAADPLAPAALRLQSEGRRGGVWEGALVREGAACASLAPAVAGVAPVPEDR